MLMHDRAARAREEGIARMSAEPSCSVVQP